MKKGLVSLLVLVVVLGLAGTSYAQEVYIGARYGWSRHKTKFGDFGIQYKSDYSDAFGVQLGLRGRHLGIEANYYETDHFLNPLGAPPAELDIERLELSSLGLNVIYFFSIPYLEPYVTAGYASYGVNAVGLEKSRKGGVNLGLGLSLRVFRSISLAAEGKYHWVDFIIKGNTLELNDLFLSLSFNYYF